MRSQAKPPRDNRIITVDFQDESTYFRLLGDGRAFVECVIAFLMSLGFQLTHKATCKAGGCLTRHSHDVRVRLNGVPIWRYAVHHVQSGVHGPATFHLALSSHEPRCGSTRPDRHARWPEFGMVRGDLSRLAHGPLSPALCVRPPQPGGRVDPVWAGSARLFLGR